MSLKISTREADGVKIIDLAGRLTLGDTSVSIRDEVRTEIDGGSLKMLLNLGEVAYIDSAGLGELISAYTSVTNRGGELKLLNLTKRVHDLMQITKLYTVFDVFDNENEAIASFRS
jgi:anti-sigma B factor antagonist